MFSSMMAISPLDGRYAKKVQNLTPITSEFGLIKFRVLIEVRWLQTLNKHSGLGMPQLSSAANTLLDNIVTNFSEANAARVKEHEAVTNHDVKAVEYFIKEQLDQHTELAAIKEFVHFGCTSEDINNLAYALMLKTARDDVLLPQLERVLKMLKQFAHHFSDIAMMARTHGQPATPTTVGKEFANFAARIAEQIEKLKSIQCKGKLNGATGSYNAFVVAYPDLNWEQISQSFVTELGLVWNPYTTQIEPHDFIAEFSHCMHHINTILIGLDQDMWQYISDEYFLQKANPKETGSSTMPHKVNPIDFENSEGNLKVSNALFELFAEKLPISRRQRDLTDSTVLRNLGVPIGHSVLAYDSFLRGMEKVSPNLNKISADLDQHWELLAEPVQMVMRKYNIANPYEKLKEFSRGKKMTRALMQEFIQTSELPEHEKTKLLQLTPDTYIGHADKLAKRI